MALNSKIIVNIIWVMLSVIVILIQIREKKEFIKYTCFKLCSANGELLTGMEIC